jgi:hypothetical protein
MEMIEENKEPENVDSPDQVPNASAAESENTIPAEQTGTVNEMQETEEQFMQSTPVIASDETVAEQEEEMEPVEDYSALGKEELVDLMEKVLQEAEIPAIKARFNTARDLAAAIFSHEQDAALAKFIEEGGSKDDFSPVPDPLTERFNKALKLFGKKRAEFNEKAEKQRTDNLSSKTVILKELKELIQNEENMKKAFDAFHDLQARWRAAGAIPSANVRDIQMTYKFYVDKFYDFIRINKELQELDFKRNLDSKLHLCELAEDLLMEPSLNTALKKLHALQDKWRETGPVPRDQKEEIWDRFKGTCDKIFAKRKEYLAAAGEKHAANLQSKIALCEAAEAVVPHDNWKHKDWQDAAKQLSELQIAWKKTGPASKKMNDEVWGRFRKSFDNFFKAKNDYYQKRKQEFAANMQQKTELCIQAEALQTSTDWKTTTAELIRLQQEWKNTGPVGERHSDKIWKRFRTACDGFFRNKTAHFSDVDKQYVENLEKKLKLIESVEAFVPGADTSENFEQLKAFQRSWTEAGLVPLAKKEEVQKRFKTAIDAHYDKLRAGEGDRPRPRYQSNRPDSGRPYHGHSGGVDKVDGERRSLMNKISELKNEVQVWENNIGFFAKSKNAETLKKEFEDKIMKAREEIARLNDQLKSSAS